MKKSPLLLLLTVVSGVHAADLGTWGDLYPIAEPDLIGTIHQRLGDMEKDGELARQQDAFKKRVIEHTLRPTPVQGLAIAQENTTRLVDPTFVVSRDIDDGKGHVFARKGQKVNPLDNVPFIDTLYFIDADDARQVAWMQHQPVSLNDKIILVSGDIQKATKVLGRRVYFDQNAVMSRKFALTAVPARVTAAPDERHLEVDTFAVEDER